MRATLDRISQTIGVAGVELLDLAERLNDPAAATVRQAAELLDQAAEVLSELYVSTAARPRARAAPSVPPPCTCGPPGMVSAPAGGTIVPLGPGGADRQGWLWSDAAA